MWNPYSNLERGFGVVIWLSLVRMNLGRSCISAQYLLNKKQNLNRIFLQIQNVVLVQQNMRPHIQLQGKELRL